MHGYATIDPLYAQGKRSFRSPELVVARSYRSWNPPKPSPVLHRNSRSDHWLLRAYGNSQRAVSASPPTRGDPDARPPYGHGKRSEESTPRGRMGTRKAVRDTPREGKNMPRWGKDLSNVEEEPLREGREERPRDLRHFYQSSSVDDRFEPQAFSSPFVDTLDPQTSFVETNYGNEVDRNSSLTSPTLDREVPEKEVSYESRTCLKSPHIFAAATQPGGAGMIICRTEYLQSGPKGETALDQKSSAPVPDMDFPDRNYVSAKLPVSSRSRHGEDGQGLKSLQPAVYVPRAHDGSPLSLYEEKEEGRADSDDNSVCSSRVSSRHQDQTFGGQSTSASTKIFRTSFELVGRSSDLNLAKPRSVTPMGVVKQAWTASSSSHITVASTSAVQLIPPALMTTGKNIVGEIAFQLERRILDYVFANHLPAVELESSGMARKRRFYGYTVNNIGEMINREALSGDYYSKGTERMLRERLRTLLDILTPLGYDLTDHARFSQDIINKYGLLSHIPVTNPGDPETEVGINGVEVEHLQNAIVCMADTEAERSNLLLILDCLRMLAIEDGRPLFVW
ncbi:uncharacterized protein LOC112559328 isoform X1 [Pomacea canaliculata]|uniref:uncharacterized protein LOC112559328 isoform X1 n=1 Tax=Pomacea canaliculata TaxID=400727 RepID=UPI000D728C0E|nr:uncharacterized protein LOC112559328 isoform X1 [Pomacea canaliculata]XP_025086248.1 uncharacterized protein LOC112559328 isoform X1 [Pomacea canaliculata]